MRVYQGKLLRVTKSFNYGDERRLFDTFDQDDLLHTLTQNINNIN